MGKIKFFCLCDFEIIVLFYSSMDPIVDEAGDYNLDELLQLLFNQPTLRMFHFHFTIFFLSLCGNIFSSKGENVFCLHEHS